MVAFSSLMVSHMKLTQSGKALTRPSAMKILDPHMRDGVHEWRDGTRVVKEGVRLYIEGTDTLAGRYIHLYSC